MTLATSGDDIQQLNATEPAPAPSPDAALLARVRSGDAAAFEVLMRRYNQRLYRVARSVVKDSAEAEDVVQQAYLLAYVNADQFAGRSSLSTWLTRIALNEALGRVRRRGRDVSDVNAVHDWRSGSNMAPDPEDQVSRRELARLLESAVDRLPENYRVVFALRELEGLDGNEVADTLGITAESVRVRLHRARAMLRDELYTTVGSCADEVFSFGGAHCDRIVARVLERFGEWRGASSSESAPKQGL